MSNIYQDIYQKLVNLGVLEIIESGVDSGKSSVPGFMDLSLDVLSTEEPAVYRVALAHYFKQNGDLCADPDMEIRLYQAQELAEALTFQMANPALYQEVYPEPNRVNAKLKSELNEFLNYWLGNCLNQQHSFKVKVVGTE